MKNAKNIWSNKYTIFIHNQFSCEQVSTEYVYCESVAALIFVSSFLFIEFSGTFQRRYNG